MSVKTIRGNRLFWKIIVVFTSLLIALGLVFFLIASRFSVSYYNSAHQQLFGDIAQHLATFTHPFKNGRPDTAVTHDIMHSTMVANPSVEVYLLDTTGKIIDYVVPDKTVQTHQVDIIKVKDWLVAPKEKRPLGVNPKQINEPSIFSAAPVLQNGQLTGYVYAVLSSEKQREILSSLNDHLYFRLSVYIFFAALLVAFLVGIVTFFLITDSICKIAGVVKKFKEGDYSARIEGNVKGNLGMLSNTFNDMADVIVDNLEKITATDKFRQELIANVSHDLRTPLSITQGYIETIIMKKDKLSSSEREKYLSIVHDSTTRLSALVEQLFQYAKLEANLVTVRKEQFLLDELAADILMTYELKAKEKSIRLNIESPSGLSPVFADIALTERVFQNLLDNALRFTPEGGRIIIRLLQGKAGVEVQVADTGVGITAEDQSYIFDRYKQSGRVESPQKGMGIGLAIVKKIMELHQTTINVSSEIGKGTQFLFVLPMAGKINPVT
ncbi:MAG: HAMP domain-containing sensor histidine kinase [Flavitalea sp.]